MYSRAREHLTSPHRNVGKPDIQRLLARVEFESHKLRELLYQCFLIRVLKKKQSLRRFGHETSAGGTHLSTRHTDSKYALNTCASATQWERRDTPCGGTRCGTHSRSVPSRPRQRTWSLRRRPILRLHTWGLGCAVGTSPNPHRCELYCPRARTRPPRLRHR